MPRGGTRENAGRPTLTAGEKKHRADVRAEHKRQIVYNELLFPGICAAWHADPGQFKDNYLTVHLSKQAIELAYGRDGLSEWKSIFTQKKVGGRNRFGQGYQTSWEVKFGIYGAVLRIVNALGGHMKNLPVQEFPPPAMRDRLHAIANRRASKRGDLSTTEVAGFDGGEDEACCAGDVSKA
jgi:hypothetical protein